MIRHSDGVSVDETDDVGVSVIRDGGSSIDLLSRAARINQREAEKQMIRGRGPGGH